MDADPPRFTASQADQPGVNCFTFTYNQPFDGFLDNQHLLQPQQRLGIVALARDEIASIGGSLVDTASFSQGLGITPFSNSSIALSPHASDPHIGASWRADLTEDSWFRAESLFATNDPGLVVPTVFTPSTAPSYTGHARQRQEPKRKRETKEQQRRAAREPTASSPEQRPYRCFRCRHDPGNRGCFNYPICDRCNLNHQRCMPSTHLQGEQFINPQRWLAICQKLSETSRISPIIRSPLVSALPGQRACSKPFILELTFQDRLQDGPLDPHVIVFRPEWQALRTLENSDSASIQLRPPAFYKHQLDDLVRRGVWSHSLPGSADEDQTTNEARLWSLIQLFTGYHVMIHNLATMFIQSSDLVTASVLGRVVAELIYAFGFYLQIHYRELLVALSPPTATSQSGAIDPAVRLYAFEVLLVLLESMRLTDWGIPRHLPQHSLIVLQQYFNKQVDHIICQFSFMQCRVSGLCTKNRRKRSPPAIVNFIRSMPATGFPTHCVLTVSRQRHSVMPEVPSPWRAGDKYRGIDILTQEYDGLFTNAENQDHSYWLAFDNAVDEHGTVLTMSDLLSSSLVQPDTSGTNALEVQSNTRKADSGISELTTRLLALREDVDITEQISNPATPDNADSVAMSGSGLPSLAWGTPLSVFSPVTPEYFSRTSAQWQSDTASPSTFM